MNDDVQVEVYTLAFIRVGFINAPSELSVTHRLNKTATATISIPAASPKAWLLMAEGHRLRIVTRGLVWSGPITKWTLDGIGRDATLTATCTSDLGWLEQIVCWPITGTLPGTLSRINDSRSGPAETVFKGYLSTAISRLGLPITVATDLGRGSTIDTQLRMKTPADDLLPLLEGTGLRATLVHNGGTTLTLDVAPIRTYGRTLTAASGVLGTDTTVSEEAATATRVVIGGAGDDTARLFRQVVNTSAESVWPRREKFIDARDIQVDAADPLMDTQAEVDAALDARAWKELSDADSKISISASLSETRWFRLAAGVLEVGDRVPVSITIPGTEGLPHPVTVEATETITEAIIDWTTDGGLVVTPKLGLADDPQGPLLWRIATISERLRAIATRK